MVPLKSLWDSTSSSEASSTIRRLPPIRRGMLPKEGSFPRLEFTHKITQTETHPQGERRACVTVSELLEVCLKTTLGVDEIQDVQVVLWLQVQHAGYICNSFDSC